MRLRGRLGRWAARGRFAQWAARGRFARLAARVRFARLAARAAGFAILVLWPALKTPADELSDRITINGYTNFEFERQLGKSGFGDKNGSFDADQFDLVFNVRATDRVRAAADLSWEHGTATEDGRGNQALEYGFVEYAFSDLLKLRVGKMFTPFGIFNEVHTAKPAFLSVKEAASLNKTERVVKGAYRFYPRWGAGIAAHGDGVIHGRDFNYDVLVANGEQDDSNPFEKDDNGAKSVTTRIRFEPSGSLRLGQSLYYDSMTDPAFDHILSAGLEVEWSRGELRVQAEAALGFLHKRAGTSVKQLGWYLQPSYHFGNGLTPYLRLDVVDPDRDKPDDGGLDLVVGLNFEAAKGFQIKLENDYFKGGTATTFSTLPGRSYNELKAAVVLGF